MTCFQATRVLPLTCTRFIGNYARRMKPLSTGEFFVSAQTLPDAESDTQSRTSS